MLVKNDSFDRFGDDLTELLLKFLPIEDKWRLQSVSKQWLQLLFAGQTDLIFNNRFCQTFEFSLKHRLQKIFIIEAIVKKCPNVRRVVVRRQSRSVEFYDIFGQFLDLLVTYCPLLQHISIEFSSDYNSLYGTLPTFDRFLQTFGPQLLTFKLSIGEINQRIFTEKLVITLPQLKRLECYGNRIEFRDLIYAQLQQQEEEDEEEEEEEEEQQQVVVTSGLLPASLRSMFIDVSVNCLPLFSQFVANYGQQLTNLSINFRFPYQTNSEIQSFVTTLLSKQFCQLKQLKILNYNYNLFIDELLRQQFSRRCCRQLRCLYLDDCSGEEIQLKSIQQLIKTFGKDLKQLKRLYINCRVINESDDKSILTIDLLKPFKQLTHLLVNLRVVVCDDRFFRDIDHNLPRLQFIDICSLDISRSTLQSLSRLRHLITVRLADCRNLVITDHQIISDLISPQKSKVTNISLTTDIRKKTFSFVTGSYLKNQLQYFD